MRNPVVAALLGALLGAMPAASPPLAAQNFAFVPRVQPEVRTEASFARYASVLAMAGANIPLGFYVRTGLAVGAGVTTGRHAAVATGADLTMRFLLDPFGESAWGPYVGGGLTVRRNEQERASAGLTLVLGVEGRRGRRWIPSIETGLGEGARFAVILRKARTNGR